MPTDRHAAIVQYVWAALNMQGRASYIMDGHHTVCRYLSHDSAKCAIGCLFPEGTDTSRLEGVTVDGRADPGVDREATLPNLMAALSSAGIDTNDPAELELLRKLQGIHDFGYGFESTPWLSRWRVGMRNLAKEMGIALPDPETLAKPGPLALPAKVVSIANQAEGIDK